MLLQTLEAKVVMATMMLMSPKEMRNKLATDYAVVLPSMAAIA